MSLRGVLFLILLQAGNATGPAPRRGSIEGTVLRVGTREPVEDVRVVLIKEDVEDIEPLRLPPSPFSLTDPQGKFFFNNVDPGRYRLTFSANGFVRQEYGQRAILGRGTQFNLADGEALKELTVELTPTGTVTGTIRDEAKRPLAGVPVQLMRVNYDYQGERRLRPSGGVVRTDDRGEFRIYFVTPGRYYLNAGTPNGPPGNGDPAFLPNEIRDTFAYTYYPGVADARFATTFDVLPGAVKAGMDMMLARIKGVRVSGRIVDSITGRPPEKPKIRLNYRTPGVSWDYDLEGMGRGKVEYKDGVFEYRDVLPGQFAVSVTVDVPGQPPATPGTTPLQRTGYLPFEVGNADVEGLVVIAAPGQSISGRLRIEGRDDWASAVSPGISKPGIGLQPSLNGAMPPTPGVPQPPYAPLNPDGTFRFENVMPGEFRLEVGWARQQFYIKEAHFGFADILAQPFQFTGREQASLEILLSPNSASIDGVVTDNRLGTVRGAQVVLIPEKSKHRIELFKSATTDLNGRFVLRNVAPGDYKLYAWDAIEPYRWFDSEFVKGDEQFARSVRLTESSRQTIDARLIPARP